MLSPGRYLEQALRGPLRSKDEVVRSVVMRFVMAGGQEEFNLDYRIKTQIELAEQDLEVLPPALARVYAEVVGFNCDTYFQLVEWFQQPDWSNPPDICRVCGAPPDAEFRDGVCRGCQWVRKNKLRIVSHYKKQFDQIGSSVKRIAK